MLLKSGHKFLTKMHFDVFKHNFLILIKFKILEKHVQKDRGVKNSIALRTNAEEYNRKIKHFTSFLD